MPASPLALHPRSDTPSAEEARRGFVALVAARSATPEEVIARYEQDVFPHAAAQVLQDREEAAKADLLVVPVGTQPYSPLLAVLATPARKVAFLVTTPGATDESPATSTSEPYAQRVRASVECGFAVEDRPEMEIFEIGAGTSGSEVVRAVMAAMLWAGDPWPADVVLDVTGGKKATTAALGGLAAVHGFRQTYIEGRPLAGEFRQAERRHLLADIGALTMGDERSAATALLEEGALEPAARRFARLVASTVAMAPAYWLAALAKALHHQDTAALQALADSMPPSLARDLLLEAPQAPAPDLAARFVDALRREGAWR